MSILSIDDFERAVQDSEKGFSDIELDDVASEEGWARQQQEEIK